MRQAWDRRRGLLAMLAGFALAICGLAPPGRAAEQAPMQIRLATVQNEGVFTEGQRKFARLVGERTGGKVQVQQICCSQLGGERAIADGVKLGTIGMGVLGAAGSPSLDLLFMPFLFRDRDHALHVVNGPVGDKLAENFHNETGTQLIGYVLQGPRQFLTSKRQIRAPADMKGMKIRAPELPVVVAALRALGASPVVIAFPELYLALQQGTADGWEGPINVMYDAKHWEVAKYLTRANWSWNFNYLIVGDDVWNKMTPETQKVVRDTWREVATEITTQLADAEVPMTEEFKRRGVEVIDVDPAPFRAATGDVWKSFAPKTWGAGVYEQIQATK